MQCSRNESFISFKLEVAVSSMMNSWAALFTPAQEVSFLVCATCLYHNSHGRHISYQISEHDIVLPELNESFMIY